MAEETRDDGADAPPDPDWGLGATADPVAFGAAMTGLGQRLVRDPAILAGATMRFATGLVEIGAAVAARTVGAKTEGPMPTTERDARFSDPAWESNPAFYGLRQCYLLWARTMREIASAAKDEELGGKAEFAVGQLVDALAPTNFLIGNPTALKRAFETGGASVARGVTRFMDDVATHGGWPRQVDTSKLSLGEDLAATPGKVVHRNRLMELIQYEPRTETVYDVPMLFSPPWINKYYVMDLAPGKSFAEWAIDQGHTVFCISYRDPDESFRDIGFEDYLREGPLEALDVVQEITGAKQVNVVALCLGATLAATMLAELARTKAGRERVRSTTLLNALVDFSDPGPLGNFVDAKTVARLEQRMARRGFLEAGEMAGTFNLLRANDLIWRYVTSSWLMGEDPPSFDILQWNEDATRMPARMHSEYLHWMYLENRLALGTLEIGGRRVSLAKSPVELYVLSAREDHITPWRGCYKTTQIAGGPKRFVLTSSGHIAGIVNPPGPKRRHWANDALPADADEWLAGATEEQGSWWEDWSRWAETRGGKRREPPGMGNTAHPPLEDAPGTYVRG